MGNLSAWLLDILLLAPGILWALTIHETSHGLAAYALGDPTAKRAGRLSLNPLRHLDPVGTLMLFVARIGWAKPVPIDPRNFRNPVRDIFLTSAAGPVSNFVNGAVLGGILAFFLWSAPAPFVEGWPTWYKLTYALLFNAMFISFALGVFNLIPVPPLDGSNILWAILPEGPRRRFGAWIVRAGRYIGLGILIIFAADFILGIPIFNILFQIIVMPPVMLFTWLSTGHGIGELWGYYIAVTAV
ncbi:MAG: site-2 protease family protein [Candidatus Coatesbacteria bacterium]|nr:MAG: site-2 protease family protein [Candidatus Coatesbacteria bacterium]